MVKKIQTEIGLLENMLLHMKVDDATARHYCYNSFNDFLCRNNVKNFPPFVEKGMKFCNICFSGAVKKNVKRANLHKITGVNSYQQRLYYGLSMNIVTVKCTKQEIEGKWGVLCAQVMKGFIL